MGLSDMHQETCHLRFWTRTSEKVEKLTQEPRIQKMLIPKFHFQEE